MNRIVNQQKALRSGGLSGAKRIVIAIIAALHLICFNRVILNAAEPTTAMDFAAWAPATAPLFVVAEDLGALEASWKKTTFFEVYEYPAMQPFWDELRTKRNGVLPTERLGISWQELRAAGTRGAAFLSWPTQTEGLGAILVTSASDSKAAMEVRDSVRKTWKQRGYDISARTIQGIEVIAAKIQTPGPATKEAANSKDANVKAKKDKAAPAAETESWRYSFVEEDRLVICDRLAVATELLARRKEKGGDSLATVPAFAEIMKVEQSNSKSPVALRWYVDPWQLWKSTLDPQSRTDRPALRRLKFFQNQGFGAVSALGGVVRFGSAEMDLEHETQLVIRGKLSKGAELLKLISGTDFKLPNWLPNSPSEVTVLNCDQSAILKGVGSIYDEIYGENYEGAFRELIDSIETDADGPQAFVRRDVFERLQPRVISLSDFGGQKSKANPSGRRRMLVVGTNDSSKTSTAIERFFNGEENVKFERLGEALIWQAHDPNQPLFKPQADAPVSLQFEAIAVARQSVILSSDREFLRETIQSSAASKGKLLPSSFTGEATGKTCSRLFRDLVPEMKTEFELAKQNKIREAGTWQAEFVYWMLFATLSNSEANAPLDLQKLPNFEDIKIGWGHEFQETELRSGGWQLHGFIKKQGKN